MAKHAREGREVFRKLSKVTDRFLTVSLDYAGWVPLDEKVPMAVCQQKAVVELFPKSPVCRAMTDLVGQIERWRDEFPLDGGLQLFGPSIVWASVEEGV
jgi:flagellar biosynthesis protein FlhG